MLDLARLHLALRPGSARLGLVAFWLGLRNALSLWAANEPLSRLYRMLATVAAVPAVTFVVSIIVAAVVVAVRPKDNA